MFFQTVSLFWVRLKVLHPKSGKKAADPQESKFPRISPRPKPGSFPGSTIAKNVICGLLTKNVEKLISSLKKSL